MKLTKSYLRKLIKEELEKSISSLADDEPSEELVKFVKILIDDGIDPRNTQAIHDAIFGALDASDRQVNKAIDKAKGLDGIEPHGDE